MELQIKSRKLGRTISFSRPGDTYIFADTNGKPGTLGEQIRNSSGSCIGYSGEDQAAFEAVCRRWYRNALPEMVEESEWEKLRGEFA